MESLLSGSSTAIFQERKLAEEERIRKEKEMDYLGPIPSSHWTTHLS